MTATLLLDPTTIGPALTAGSCLWQRVEVGGGTPERPGEVVLAVDDREPGTYEVHVEASLAPDPADQPTWLTLMASSALAEAVRGDTGVAVWSVWPDRLIAPDGQCIATVSATATPTLTRVAFDIVLASDGRPFTGAPASLEQYAAQRPAAASLVIETLRGFERLYRRWSDFARRPGPSGLVADYGSVCGSIRVDVEAELHDGTMLLGTAEGVDLDGRLVVRHEGSLTALDPGDVVGVRPLAVLPS
ncbi:hypothetical protein [Micromonospora sp. HUAS LYJ1]|uniref:hypothetical protein n=1 Tax=Micromonospora sp. HUAS LYJ1 TaxID=3061626 RepID=UPI002671C512|nr:hypothetical protein [Micromonospora sp. HUAS LYJ1]WKU03543.1 hypothetical protein Q2K16_22215 [Micromonospora sp. HUAS LYJ1]